MSTVICKRCKAKMPRSKWDAHASKCVPPPYPGESFAAYQNRIAIKPSKCGGCGTCPRCIKSQGRAEEKAVD